MNIMEDTRTINMTAPIANPATAPAGSVTNESTISTIVCSQHSLVFSLSMSTVWQSVKKFPEIINLQTYNQTITQSNFFAFSIFHIKFILDVFVMILLS